MSVSSSRSDSQPDAYLAQRRARLERLLLRPLTAPTGEVVPPERRRFLREEAEELYWNELAWEKLTSEEAVERDGLVEHAFPGFLAFIDGLLLREVAAGSPVPASPRPQVVEDLLVFLAKRCTEARPAVDEETYCEHGLSERLLDLVQYRLYDLSAEEVEMLEAARLRGDE